MTRGRGDPNFTAFFRCKCNQSGHPIKLSDSHTFLLGQDVGNVLLASDQQHSSHCKQEQRLR